MIAGALKLLAAKGLQRASFHEVTKATDTPRGSIYYHFPGGKSELVREALQYDVRLITTALDEVHSEKPSEFLDGMFDYWRNFLVDNECKLGCAIAAVAIAAEDDEQLEAARTAFDDLTAYMAGRLEAVGMEKADADCLARQAYAAMEGATVMIRASQDMKTYDDAIAGVLEVAKKFD